MEETIYFCKIRSGWKRKWHESVGQFHLRTVCGTLRDFHIPVWAVVLLPSQEPASNYSHLLPGNKTN